MGEHVVVLGTGYAGTSALQHLESLRDDIHITWVGDRDYHLVLHEAHRAIRDPDVEDKIKIPVEDIKSAETDFVRGHVVDIDSDDRLVELANGRTIDYDYALVAIGSQTAYHGVPGLELHAHKLKSLDDALSIHEEITSGARYAGTDDPLQVVIGGAGLTGVQIAGEIAELRDDEDLPVDIHVVGARDRILSGQDTTLQQSVEEQLREQDVELHMNTRITRAESDAVELDDGSEMAANVLIWAGGITGRDVMDSTNLETERNRVKTDATFQTSDQRVFALGDAALVEDGADQIPPTAQAAWQAAEVAANNISWTIDGEPLETWTYTDKGTLVSIGEAAVANVPTGPVDTFGSYPAKFLKKFVAARWIADVSSWREAIGSWSSL
ncbi:FAD-dependent oxidoreductase [Haloarculaceae archaeon H-GB2-1]|nr:FAD-dependent oxidoreductase [Haloarculaceae archaeon H-GB1-1]MEA5387079.1 FAD-dependent oxidoreductase [Haloarculaceae archaeon H-GB11]MEA5408584.1 FAD-dependent oxidoreductase [Haloarculaceae archaeon H-GB2-1]